ncbi:ufm1-specific protease 2 [Sitodiplosis mosellana]|uniref:ufm1-specific protease 2 n=1 Tax=Sitodiplosis mosellana TaxID=263140 RepID=UPI00244527D2|nr:ufm1-specific protease 2 [Sitodiplosis mosellana]
MSVAMKLSKCFLLRIEHVKTATKGRLYGLVQNNAILVMGFSLNESIENNLPIGFKDVGPVQWSSDDDFNKPEESDSVQLKYNLQSSDNQLVVGWKNKSNEWETVSYDELTEDELKREWVCLRTQFQLKYSIENTANYREQLIELLESTRKKICETNKPILCISGTEIILKKDKGLVGIGKNAKINAAIQQTKNDQNPSQSNPNQFETLNIVLAAGDDDAAMDDISSIFSNVSLNNSTKSTQIDFDALAFVRLSMGANQMYEIILKSIDRNISCIEATVTDVERPLHTFVFYPKVLGHFISYVYPTTSADDDKDQITQRKQNHTHLNFSRPYLRRDDAYSFSSVPPGTQLFNPHIGLKNLVKDGKQYIVKGDYLYYHYMQDNFDDNGWGCAYRSFQTLFSWFRLQGYTNKSVPTHGEIQKCLIELGDKPTLFQNSRQWIGSTEVSMCLQYFLNVDSRILHVTSGSDMAQHGPTFAQHFTTYGTPIMIGGGVLAHTILGIDYNSQTNELKFLVLDPHYTGADDLDVIQKKGWCAWKPVTFWDKKSYYNCCMPMFPDATDY